MIVDGEEDGGTVENDFSAFESQANGEEVEQVEEKEEKTPPADDAANPEQPEEVAEDEGGEESGEEGDDPEKDQKPKQTAEERIRELNRKYREEQRAREQDRLGFEARLAALETGKKDLTPEKDGGKNTDEREPPNPKDLEKYPLGALDDRYIQDAIAFQAEKSAKEMVDSLLQRQEQSAQEAEAERQLAELRSKADNVAAKGTELHPDYQDVVVEAGMRGDYDLTQTTFEAAAEADHGAEILYALATNPAEASRVAKLSAFQQLKYVADKNAEIAGKGTSAKKIPGAGAPPQTIPAGKGGRKTISANTDNFEEFERLANSKSR